LLNKKHLYLGATKMQMSKYKNILLIEDDEDDRDFFMDTLKELYPAVNCIAEENGHTALNRLSTLSSLPDIIILDLNMPVMGGREFLRLVKTDIVYSAYKNIPVVILTTSSNDQERCYALGADLYITKPSSVGLFRTMLTHVLTHDVVKDTNVLRALFNSAVLH
jgi:CheY-like chemotaxis protein